MSDAGPHPALVLLNPQAAGGRAAALAGPLARHLDQARAAHGLQARLEGGAGIDDARRLIRSLPAGTRVVLVGGDGTVHQMLPALLEARCSWGLVPMGSGNDTARALGLAGLRWLEALQLALEGRTSLMDVGVLDCAGRKTPFASSLTAGFDAAVGLRALRGPTWLRGLPRYLWATLGELATLRRTELRVEIDGEPVHDGPALFVSALNTPTYGSGMPAVPHARTDDGRLDALVAGRFGRLGTAMMLPRLLAGAHLGHPKVMTRPFVTMSVAAASEVPLAADGEPAGRARAWRIAVQAGALAVVRRHPGTGQCAP